MQHHRRWLTAAFLAPLLCLSATRAARGEEAAVEVGYERGLFARDPGEVWRLRLNAGLQPRLFASPSLDDGDLLEAGFLLRRVRLVLGGGALVPELSFRAQVGFDLQVPELKDAWVQYAIVPEALLVRVGRFKRPFSRQQITSGFALELVERAITEDAFDTGRDVGVALMNDYEDSPPLEYVVGVFHGAELVAGEPVLFRPTFVGRLGTNLGELDGYSEADLEGGPLRIGVAGSARVDLDVPRVDGGRWLAEVDWIAKVAGLSTTGAVYVGLLSPGEGFPTLASAGVLAQVGYVLDDTWQPALRYALVVPATGPRLHEVTAGFSVYLVEHALKWQNDASLLVEVGAGEVEESLMARSQLSFVF